MLWLIRRRKRSYLLYCISKLLACCGLYRTWQSGEKFLEAYRLDCNRTLNSDLLRMHNDAPFVAKLSVPLIILLSYFLNEYKRMTMYAVSSQIPVYLSKNWSMIVRRIYCGFYNCYVRWFLFCEYHFSYGNYIWLVIEVRKTNGHLFLIRIFYNLRNISKNKWHGVLKAFLNSI